MAPLDEAKRARLQAKLDEETSKTSLARKVRPPRPARSTRASPPRGASRPDADQRPISAHPNSGIPHRPPPPPQVAAAKTPAKMRTLVQSTNDKNMFISGHKPAPKRVVSSGARRSTSTRPSRPLSREPAENTSLVGMPAENPAQNASRPPERTRPKPSTREWAVMSAFEREVHARQQAELAAEHRRRIDAQRAALDEQMRVVERRKAAAAEDKAKLATAVAVDVATYAEEEERKREARKAADARTKAAQEAMLAEVYERRAVEERRRVEEEAAAIAEIRRQLDEEKAAKLAKTRAAKEAYERTMAFNEEQNALKAKERARLAEEEAATARAYEAKLEAEERRREAALAAFHEKIAARANKAGESVVASANAAQEAEARRMKKFHDEREAALAAREAAARERRAAATEAQLATLETQLALKARESAAEREEDAKYAEEVRSAAAEAKEAEARLEAERRERAVANRLDLERQIAEKTRRRVADHDDVMDEQERLFNAAILDQATRVVVGGEDF